MLSTTAKGTLLITASGVVNTANLVFSKFLRTWGWPYFRIYGLSCLTVALFTITVLAVLRRPSPNLHLCKWVVLRGFFGVLTYVLSVVAVYDGTPMGDVATLTSINMVVAAFLGRLLLGEPLAWIHIVALLCSFVGAVLIAKPSFLFPAEVNNAGWLGYVLALASGLAQACVFICSRKSASVSAWLHLLSTMAQAGLASFLLPLLPGAEEGFAALVAAPLPAAAWIAFLAATMLSGSLTLSVGSMWCPAAVSATATTAVRMGCSYVAQVVLFGEPVGPVTLAGAGLMLVGVMAMAGWRSSPSQEVQVQSVVEEGSMLTEDTESLASFIAAEFVDTAHHEKTVRQRRASCEPPAREIGVVAAVASVAI